MNNKNEIFKVCEVKNEEEMNDRYFDNYESAKENLEYRLSEMMKSDYYLEHEKVKEEEILNKDHSVKIKEMYYVFAKTNNAEHVLTILIMKERF